MVGYSWRERAIVGLALAFWLAGRADAHDVEAAITPSADAVRVEFFFADATPAAGFAVTATYADGTKESLEKTDADGKIIFRPTQLGACVLYARAAGHGKKVTIPADVIAAVFHAPRAGEPDAATSQPASAGADAFGPSKRKAKPFPITEALASVAFVAALSLVTYILLWRAGRTEPDEREALRREVEALRATVERLEQERNAP